MFIQLDGLLILGATLSVSIAAISLYYSYNRIKQHEGEKTTDNMLVKQVIPFLKEGEETQFNDLLRNERQEILYRFIKNDGKVPNIIADTAIKELCSYSINKKPNYIMGINRGGVMVGAMASLAIDIPSSNFLRCYVGADDISCHAKEITGAVIIIDDISRTGATLEKAKNYILKHFSGVSEVITATLFMYSKNETSAFQGIDYFSYKVNSPNTMLPWNTLTATKEKQYLQTEKQTVNDLALELQHHI